MLVLGDVVAAKNNWNLDKCLIYYWTIMIRKVRFDRTLSRRSRGFCLEPLLLLVVCGFAPVIACETVLGMRFNSMDIFLGSDGNLINTAF